MGLIGFYVLLAIAVGIGAEARGRSGFGWVLLSLLLSPIITLIILVLLPNNKGQPALAAQVKCPDCAELVLAEARVCKHCRCTLTPAVDLSKVGVVMGKYDN